MNVFTNSLDTEIICIRLGLFRLQAKQKKHKQLNYVSVILNVAKFTCD